MIQPHRLPIDTPVVYAEQPYPVHGEMPYVQPIDRSWPDMSAPPPRFRECFNDWPTGEAPAIGIELAYAAYLRLNPDLPQNKKPEFEIGAV